MRSRVERSRVDEAQIGVSFAGRSERNVLADSEIRGIGFIGVRVDGSRNRLDGNEVFDRSRPASA